MQSRGDMATENVCASCGRAVARPEEFGTGADGRRVDEYCVDCLRAGRFAGAATGGDDLRTRLRLYLRDDLGLAEEEARARADHLAAVVGTGGFAAAPFLLHRGVTASWWALILRGLLALAAGVLLLFWPGLSLVSLVLAFAVWAFVDGLLALGAGIGGRSWQLVLIGVLGITAGVLTFWRPGVTLVALYAVAAAWSITRGVLEVAAAIELRHRIHGAAWFAVAGLLSIAFGVLLIVLPQAGLLALVWLIGVYALAFGLALIVLGVQARRLRGERRVAAPRRPAFAP